MTLIRCRAENQLDDVKIFSGGKNFSVGKNEPKPGAVMDDDEEYMDHQSPRSPITSDFCVRDDTLARQKSM